MVIENLTELKIGLIFVLIPLLNDIFGRFEFFTFVKKIRSTRTYFYSKEERGVRLTD